MSLAEGAWSAGALLLGGALARLLHRSGFSLDRAFRWAMLRGDPTWFRGYAFALCGVWILLGLGALGPWRDLGQPLAVSPLATMLAGFASGLAIGVLAGCPLSLGAGAGGTDVRAVAAFAAWVGGVLLGTRGPLAPFFEWIQRAGPAELRAMRLAELLGVPQALLLLACGAAAFAWLSRAPVRVAPGTVEWPKLGAWLAGLTLAGWAVARHGGETGGLNAVEAVDDAWSGVTGAPLWLAPSVLAGVGLLATAFAGAVGGRRLVPATVVSWPDLAILLAGGGLLGLASALAGGDPASRALFGMGVLHLGSAVFTLALCCGAWLVGILEWEARGRPGGKPARARPLET